MKICAECKYVDNKRTSLLGGLGKTDAVIWKCHLSPRDPISGAPSGFCSDLNPEGECPRWDAKP